MNFLRTVIHLYSNWEAHTLNLNGLPKDSYFGFGDYLRGSVLLLQVSKLNPDYKILFSYSGHQLSRFLFSDIDLTSDEVGATRFVLSSEEYDAFDFSARRSIIFTNKFPAHDFPLTSDFLQEVRNRVFRPRPTLEETFCGLMASLKLQSKRFIVIHARLGDEDFPESVESRDNRFFKALEALNLPASTPIVLLDDTRGRLASNPISRSYVSTGFQGCHLGRIGNSEQVVLETILEFMLIMNASQVLSYSVYKWGSGFCNWGALLGGAKLFRFQ